MIYNPIFEEEKERKLQFKQLKKEIKKRAHKENINEIMSRVYNLLKRKPILTMTALLHPITNLFRISKAEDSLIEKKDLSCIGKINFSTTIFRFWLV